MRDVECSGVPFQVAGEPDGQEALTVVRQSVRYVGKHAQLDVSAGAVRRPGPERPWAGRGRQAPIRVARVRRAHRHLMPTSRKAARHRVRQSRDASVRPGVTAVRSYVQHTQGLHTIGRPHMSVIGSSQPPLAGGRRTLVPVPAACAALLAALLYLNALDNPFVYDDFRLIVENPSILNGSDLQSVIVRDITRPLVNLSYAIDTMLWGQPAVRISRDQPAVPRPQRHARLLGGTAGRRRPRASGRPASLGQRLTHDDRGGCGPAVCDAPDDDSGRRLHQRPVRSGVLGVLPAGVPLRPALDAWTAASAGGWPASGCG